MQKNKPAIACLDPTLNKKYENRIARKALIVLF